MSNLNVSIVLFENSLEEVKRTIKCCLSSALVQQVYLIDNSPTDRLRELLGLDSRITYIFNNANLGFGKGHNIALRKSIEENIPYHLVLNPDVYFEEGVLEELYNFMEENQDVV